MKAVVADALNSYSVVDVDLAPPKAGEVLVRMAATGVCHSDLSMINGTIPTPFPTVLGHEGAGDGGGGRRRASHGVAPGDHVILSFIPHCGECFHCVRDEPYLCSVAKQDGNLLDGTTRVSRNGEPVFVMSFLGNMAEYAVVPSISVVPIGEGRAVPVRRPGRVRGHDRGRRGGQDRGGAARARRWRCGAAAGWDSRWCRARASPAPRASSRST